MVATDGHRLSIVEREFSGAVGKELGKGTIFPKKGIFELKKMAEEEDGELLLGFMDNNAVIKRGNTTVVMRLVDGEFPDYTKVVPQNNDKTVRVNREIFLHSLKRMAILSSEKFKGIKFDIKAGVMEISSSNPELGEAREEVEIAYDAAPLTSRFNARYLIDVLSVLVEPEVELLFRDEAISRNHETGRRRQLHIGDHANAALAKCSEQLRSYFYTWRSVFGRSFD